MYLYLVLLMVLIRISRFFGLFGIYYSLEYLSLSDATVLTFLAPMCTAIAGALLLGEKFTRREAIAGRKPSISRIILPSTMLIVFSC
jgi:drug/metabolite transporter (DMT)-like permease